MNALFAAHALLPTGWASDVLLRWDDAGNLQRVEPGATPDAGTPRASGVLLPGQPGYDEAG